MRRLVPLFLVLPVLAPFGCAAILGDDFKVGGSAAAADGSAADAGALPDAPNNSSDARVDQGGGSDGAGIGPLVCDSWVFPVPRVVRALANEQASQRYFERMWMYRVSPQVVHIVTRRRSGPESFVAYTIDTRSATSSIGNYEMNDTTNSGQLLDVARFTGSLGVLEYVGPASTGHLRTTSISDTWVGGSITVAPTPITPSGSFPNPPDSAKLVETRPGRYFYVAQYFDSSGSALAFGAASATYPPLVLATGPNAMVNLQSSWLLPNDKYVYAILGGTSNSPVMEYRIVSDGMTSPTASDIRQLTAEAAQVIPYIAAPAGANAFDLAVGFVAGLDVRFQMGQVQGPDLLTFPAESFGYAYRPVAVERFPADKGSARWKNDELIASGGSPSFPGAPQTGPGLNLLWITKDGVVKAEAYGTKKLISDHPSIQATAIDWGEGVPGVSQLFDVAWVESISDNGQPAYEALLYNTLSCHK